MLSKMIFRILCRSDLLDFIDGGAGVFWGVKEEIKTHSWTCLLYDSYKISNGEIE